MTCCIAYFIYVYFRDFICYVHCMIYDRIINKRINKHIFDGSTQIFVFFLDSLSKIQFYLPEKTHNSAFETTVQLISKMLFSCSIIWRFSRVYICVWVFVCGCFVCYSSWWRPRSIPTEMPENSITFLKWCVDCWTLCTIPHSMDKCSWRERERVVRLFGMIQANKQWMEEDVWGLSFPYSMLTDANRSTDELFSNHQFHLPLQSDSIWLWTIKINTMFRLCDLCLIVNIRGYYLDALSFPPLHHWHTHLGGSNL